VRVSGLVKRYEARAAVDGLELSVREGECYALLGPNGAGKTTTIEILEGMRRRDAGDVEVLGVDPERGDRTWRGRIGFVSQSEALVPALTVRETLDHFANYHVRPRESGELIDAVGLADKTGTRVGGLSGGQRRRLAVALGLQGRPELVFMDEPTTGLDPFARRQFWALIQRLRDDGTTVLLTTHYLDEAARLADRVGVLVNGRLVDVAPPAELGGALRDQTTVTWSEHGRYREATTATPSAFLRDLLSRTPDAEVPGLTVTRPTLEDVYLRMIGVGSETHEESA
jgi:ABC-2 type transport system ATP-binding protein